MPGTYEEIAFAPGLTPWVDAFWRLGSTEGHVERVVPDGCIDLVWTQSGGLVVAGANRTAFLAPLEAGSGAVGVRFRPGAAPAFLGVPAEAVSGASLPAAMALGEAGRRLEEAVLTAPDSDARQRVLTAWVSDRGRRCPLPDPLVATVVARLTLTAGAGVGSLPAALNVSERHLRRRVVSQVGYGPKSLARILRFQAARRAVRLGMGLAQVASDFGFADQAHFTNDCRSLAGVTPGQLGQ